MQETLQALLEETSELLNTLASVVKRSVDALRHDPNPLLQHLIQQEVEHQEGLLQQIEKMNEGLHNYLNPPAPDLRHNEDLRRQSYPSSGGALGVTMFGTEQIRRATGAATFAEAIGKVIEKVGVQRVIALGIECRYIPLVDFVRDEIVAQKPYKDYYIAVDSSTSRKITILDEISERLGVDLIADYL